MISQLRACVIMCIIITSASTSYAKKPIILTSITPIGSIVSQLVHNVAEVDTIHKSSGCPHHYQLLPSDKYKVNNADILIFIDEEFDVFASKLSSSFSGKIIQISNFKEINFKDANNKVNWHFWLDLNNVLILQNILTQILLKEIPEFKNDILANQKIANHSILYLAREREKFLDNMQNDLILLTDSLEHFFTKSQGNKVIKEYQSMHSSLKKIYALEVQIKNHQSCILVIDSNQNNQIYKKFNRPIIEIESENWLIDSDYPRLFHKKYLQIISQLQNNKHK